MNKLINICMAIALLAPGLAFAAWETNLPVGVTDLSKEVYDLHMLVIWICVGIGVVVFGVMGYSIFKHRKSQGAEAATWHESLKLEIIWTAAPIAILVFLFFPAIDLLKKMEDSSNADLVIKVTGYQWKWQYEYPEQGISFFSNLDTKSREASALKSGIDPATVDNYLLEVDNPVVVPVGKKIQFLFTSNDVLHAWGVPELAIKKDAVPGFINDMWAKINTPGIYRGQCVELCGKDHGFMPIKVVAKTEAEYQSWVEEKQAEAKAAAEAAAQQWSMEDLVKRGEEVYNTSCAACHQAGGQGIPGVFPGITGSSIATGDIDAHTDIIMNGKPGTAMQAFAGQLNDADLAAVITFQRNGLGNSVGDMIQPTEIGAKR